MPGPRSAVEDSPHRKEIEKMIIEGKSPRYISKWLKELEEDPESISHTSINNYKNNKFNVKKDAVKEYNDRQSKARKTRAKNKIVSDLEFLDNIKDIASKVNVTVDEDTKALDVVKVGIQAVKAKNEILKSGEGDDKEFTIKIVAVDPDEDDNVEAGKETSG